MNKNELLQGYINKCEACTNELVAKELQNEIINVFSAEIKYITKGLDNYDTLKHITRSQQGLPRDVDFIGDIKLLKAKLENYKADLESNRENEIIPSQIINVNQNTAITVSFSFDQTISAVQNIPNDKLAENDKDILLGKVTALHSVEKDKSKFWEKAQGVLK